MSYSYEIEYNGKTIRCRTLKDAQQAIAAFDGSTLTRADAPWSNDDFKQFTARIRSQQRRLLAKLLEYGTDAWTEDYKLRDLLELESNKGLAGTLSGISKVALMFDIDPRRVYVQRTVYRQAKPTRTYQISSGFAEAAAKYKWPSKGDLKEQK
ncbi:MAG TPA: hypothetical protein VFP59_14290 [Candidatus Angelobacter sp.]|nr:hypothetical protein [Candidatus Angelobacter sp.]